MQAMLGVLEKSEHELGMEGDVATLQPIQEQPAGSEKEGRISQFFQFFIDYKLTISVFFL